MTNLQAVWIHSCPSPRPAAPTSHTLLFYLQQEENREIQIFSEVYIYVYINNFKNKTG